MAFPKPTSFITDPEDEASDYALANTPSTPKYVAPTINSPSEFDAMNPTLTPAQSSVPPPDVQQTDPDLDPNAYSPVVKQKTAAELRHEVEELEAKRPEDKNPGFWRTLAGIGAGIGVGYLTRNPNMVAQVQGQVMHPGAAKVEQWAGQVADKTAQAQAQEKVDADQLAATTGAANLANKQADTAYKTEQTHQLQLPGAPPSPEWDVKDGVVFDKHSATPPPAPPPKPPQGDANMQLGIAAWKQQPGNQGKEPGPNDLAAIHQIFNPVNQADTDTQLGIRTTGKTTGNKVVDMLTPQEAAAALEAKKVRPDRPPNEGAEKSRAINRAFVDSGNDWNKVLDNVRAGKYPDYAGDIADHALKMTQLKPDAQRKVVAADTTAQQVQAAIDGIDEVVKSHPELVGNAGAHPINALTRLYETHVGSEPPDVGAVDSALETAAALQPGQHNFRSIGALAEFKKALGIDPRTGKADGSRAWLANPEKAKAALKAVADFNQRLKENTLNEAGQGTRQQAAPAAAPAVQNAPSGVAAKTYTQADVDAAVASHPGLTPAQADQAFQAKGWVKK